MTGCDQSSKTPNNTLVKDEALNAITSFKNTLMTLKVFDREVESVNGISLLSDEQTTLPKETLSSLTEFQMSNLNNEWIDMSILILDFTEDILETDYVLGDEVKVLELREDITWGWYLDKNTQVIITYLEETLHLKVINSYMHLTASTFLFQYNQEDLIEILRIEETYSQEQPELYVEYFIENIGISMGSLTGYTSYVPVRMTDGGIYYFYKISQENQIDIHFIAAVYKFDDMDIIVSKQIDQYIIKYDLYKYPGFDSYSETGDLFFQNELIILNEDIIFQKWGRKSYLYIEQITEVNNQNLSKDSLGFNTDLTTTDITSNIDSITPEQIDQAMKYPYYDADRMYEALNSYLYFNYSNENDVVISYDTNGGTIIPAQVIEKGSVLPLEMLSERTGSLFLGWSYVDGGDIIEEESIIITNDTILYAVFELINPKTITYYDNNLNTIYSIQVIDGNYQINVDYNIPGYKFLGWATSLDGEPIYQLYDTIEVSGDLSLYAIFEPIES